MTGLAYKEWKQNQGFLLLTLIVPVLIAYPVCAWFLHSTQTGTGGLSVMELIRQEQMGEFWLMFQLAAFLATGLFQGMIFSADAKKVRAMWAAASPEGVAGFVRGKYLLTFAMSMIGMFSLQTGDFLMEMICAANDASWFGMADFMMLFFWLQIILRAVDIPLTLRFGLKNGSLIKSIFMIAIGLAVMIVVSNFGEQLVGLYEKATEQQLGTAVNLLLGLLPVIALVMYGLSYKLSCKVYMKGAEQYDK